MKSQGFLADQPSERCPDCSEPSLASRGLEGTSLQRSFSEPDRGPCHSCGSEPSSQWPLSSETLPLSQPAGGEGRALLCGQRLDPGCSGLSLYASEQAPGGQPRPGRGQRRAAALRPRPEACSALHLKLALHPPARSMGPRTLPVRARRGEGQQIRAPPWGLGARLQPARHGLEGVFSRRGPWSPSAQAFLCGRGPSRVTCPG